MIQFRELMQLENLLLDVKLQLNVFFDKTGYEEIRIQSNNIQLVIDKIAKIRNRITGQTK